MHPSEQLKGISPFVYAAEAGSFSAAALRLHLTSSAISKSVSRLEQRLGVLLFERTTRTLRLTDAGAAFYETCKRVLAELAEAEAVLAAQRSDPSGRLRIDLPASFGRLRVMPLLLEFADHYPNLRLHISFTDRFIDLLEEGVDAAVRIGGGAVWPAALGHHYLGSERLIFCAAPAYLARRGTPAGMAALEGHDSITFGRPDGSVMAWRFGADAAQAPPPAPRARLVVGDAEAQLAAVRGGLGLAQLATWLVQADLDASLLVEILPELAVDGLPLHLVWPRARQLTPKIDALLQALQGCLLVR